MLKGTKKYWFIAIICGLAAAGLFYVYLGQVEEKYRPDDLITVVKAAQPIYADQVISAAQLMTEEIPARYAHPNAVTDISEAAGKMVTSDIAAGEEILKEKLVGEKEKIGRLAYKVPLNKRAVSISVDEVSAVSFNVQPGDHVDIMLTVDIENAGAPGSPTNTILMLQDIEVLSVGAKGAAANTEISESYATLTLAVTPQQAQPLVLGTEVGNITLLLRSPVDESVYSLAPFRLINFIQ